MTNTKSPLSSRTLLALLGVLVVVLVIAFGLMAFRSDTGTGLLPSGTEPTPVSYMCPDDSMYIVEHHGSEIEVAGTRYALSEVTNQYQNELSPVTFGIAGSVLTVFSGGEAIATCNAGATASPEASAEVVADDSSAE